MVTTTLAANQSSTINPPQSGVVTASLSSAQASVLYDEFFSDGTERQHKTAVVEEMVGVLHIFRDHKPSSLITLLSQQVSTSTSIA